VLDYSARSGHLKKACRHRSEITPVCEELRCVPIDARLKFDQRFVSCKRKANPNRTPVRYKQRSMLRELMIC
jgi:hypothetical protein